MATLASQTALIGGVLAIFTVPLVIFARRSGQRDTIRNFVIAVVVISLLCGAIALNSERLINQCLEARNVNCDDRGGAGLQTMFAGGYAVVATVRTYFLWHD